MAAGAKQMQTSLDKSRSFIPLDEPIIAYYWPKSSVINLWSHKTAEGNVIENFILQFWRLLFLLCALKNIEPITARLDFATQYSFNRENNSVIAYAICRNINNQMLYQLDCEITEFCLQAFSVELNDFFKYFIPHAYRRHQ